MGLALGLIVIMFAALCQVSVMPSFSIWGVHPNLLIAILVAWIAVRGRREALILIPLAGLALGLLDGEPLGLAMLALAPLILLTDVQELHVIESSLLPAVALVALATLSYESAILLTLAIAGEQLDWLASMLDVLVPAVIANVLLLLPVYGIVRLASWDKRQQRAF
jgi:rod shape-determining protein MreD